MTGWIPSCPSHLCLTTKTVKFQLASWKGRSTSKAHQIPRAQSVCFPMLGPLPNESANSWSSGADFGRGASVWVAGEPGELLKPLSTTLFGIAPTDPTTAAYLTNHLPFPPPPSILPQAALEEIHRFSGTYTCMNTFKGRT